MVLIFSGSSDTNSFQHSSRIIEPFVRWLFPHISPKALDTIVLLIRKLAHMTEYGILALFTFRALRHTKEHHSGGWSRSTASLTLAIAALYAATDEFHQAFVPTREASIRDVLLDISGAALALFFCWLFMRRGPKSAAGQLKPAK